MIGNRTNKINKKNNVPQWLGCNQGFFSLKENFQIANWMVVTYE